MSENKCLLCENKNVLLVENIDTRQLSRLYKSRAGVDVRRFFDEGHLNLFKCPHCDLGFYSPQISGDSRFYDELQNYRGYFLKNKTEYSEAAKFINAKDDVLEVGCGEGLFTDHIQYRSYIGLEFSGKAIATARNKGLDIIDQPLEEHAGNRKEKYDVVCFFQVLEHIDQPREFIHHALACLKKGGKLIIAVPSNDSFIRDAPNFYLNMPPHHISTWSDKSLQKIADIFQLKVEAIIHEPLHPIHESFYLKTGIFNKLSKFFGMTKKQVDTSPGHTLLYSVAAMTALITKPFFKPVNKIKGQSVVCIYNKP